MLEGLRVSPEDRTDDIDLWLTKMSQIYRDGDTQDVLLDSDVFSKRNKNVIKICSNS